MRLLIIDDDTEIVTALQKSLEMESFAVDSATDGERGSYHARTNDYDAVILDHMLPKKDGGQVCREIRAAGKTTPILMLSAISTIDQKIKLLNSGADDYMTKPCSYRELVARINALLRRPPALLPDTYTVGSLSIDMRNQKVSRGKEELYLTRKEFSLLEYLVRNQGMVVTRGMIMEHVWNAESDPFSNTIEAHILNIRRKICTKSEPLIRTLPGRGYIID